jgi:putative transposase
LIGDAIAAGAHLSRACAVLEISPRTIQRWQHHQSEPDQRKSAAQQRVPENKLSEKERDQIVTICNQKQFANMAPNQIVPILADQGTYVASESSFYRVLRKQDQLAHRGKAKAPRHNRPQAIEATGPNDLWSWDITYLPTAIKGLFFYLYMIMDIYSRKIVGWEVHDTESSDHSSMLIRKTYLREGVAGKPLVLHSDNGSPMKGATMLVTLQKLGVMPSFSRPSVSNDNAYSEALFKTLKYSPGYPDKPFDSIEQAQQWVLGFQHWYNEIHRHSAIKFVTPGQRHRREDVDLLKMRSALYNAAKAKCPERWSGAIRNWQHEQVVYLNPTKSDQKIRKAG